VGSRIERHGSVLLSSETFEVCETSKV